MTKRIFNLRNIEKGLRLAIVNGDSREIAEVVGKYGYDLTEAYSDNFTIVKFKNPTKIATKYVCTVVQAYSGGNVQSYLIVELRAGKWDKKLFDRSYSWNGYTTSIERSSFGWRSLLNQPKEIERDDKMHVLVIKERAFSLKKCWLGKQYIIRDTVSDYYCSDHFHRYHVMYRIAGTLQAAL